MTEENTEERLLSTNEIAHRLHVGTDTVRRWLNVEGGMAATLIGTHYVITQSEFDRFMRERQGRKKKT